ncbi:MAG: hypothetical protein B7Z60_01445 [Ferrovum sp. 37-45-19]|nr:MAG: hypothetical protein B7Z65_00330 [Ferrovum sp. 21-44-67]OYV95228.1 MAG: hypothetical protein B7Z60_01445 [Ferrovum sp. 37-45-19]HQT80731.1 cell division protein ZipA C-terminal FtsZ-binding domain-containing protein [Ferrovaceae bacterium]HQU05941.1 cell division protein ZipA C-terminal FtsZ-binding domain-containing protein [Ferrovaceae bacterium]
MTSLQIYLIIMGVVLVIVFLFIGRVQAYRYKKTIINDEPKAAPVSSRSFEGDDEPLIRLAGHERETQASHLKKGDTPISLKQVEEVNSKFEWSVLFSAEEDLQYRPLVQAIQSIKGLYGSVNWQVYETDSESWVDLEKFDSSQTYRYLRVIMPVSSRSGPLTETRWQEVIASLTLFATGLHLTIRSHREKELFERAKTIEEFCAKVDIMIGLNILFGEKTAVSMSGVKNFLLEKGLSLEDDGLFHAFNASSQALYTLGDKDLKPILDIETDPNLLKGLTFIIDVPQIRDVAEAITDAFTCANELVANFGGIVVDDNLKPLGIKQIERIKKQMDKIHLEMNEFGITPGEAVAKKLFSM